jgi:hypothetical protein
MLHRSTPWPWCRSEPRHQHQKSPRFTRHIEFDVVAGASETWSIEWVCDGTRRRGRERDVIQLHLSQAWLERVWPTNRILDIVVSWWNLRVMTLLGSMNVMSRGAACDHIGHPHRAWKHDTTWLYHRDAAMNVDANIQKNPQCRIRVRCGGAHELYVISWSGVWRAVAGC